MTEVKSTVIDAINIVLASTYPEDWDRAKRVLVEVPVPENLARLLDVLDAVKLEGVSRAEIESEFFVSMAKVASHAVRRAMRDGTITLGE